MAVFALAVRGFPLFFLVPLAGALVASGCHSSDPISTPTRSSASLGCSKSAAGGNDFPTSYSLPKPIDSQEGYVDISELPGASPEAERYQNATYRKLGSVRLDKKGDRLKLDTGSLFPDGALAENFNAGMLIFQGDRGLCLRLLAVDDDPIIGPCRDSDDFPCYGTQKYAPLYTYGFARDEGSHSFSFPVMSDDPIIRFDASYKIEFENMSTLPNQVEISYMAKSDRDFKEGSIALNLYFFRAFERDAPLFTYDELTRLRNDIQAIFGRAGIRIARSRATNIVSFDLVAKALDNDYPIGVFLNELALERARHSGFESGINVFVFERISSELTHDGAGGGLLGLAAAIPGPGNLATARDSGVVVSTLSASGGSQSADRRAVEIARSAYVIAHEVGHYLGLFHTTEINGFSVAGDRLGTLRCERDENGSVLDSDCEKREFEQLMFWRRPPELGYILNEDGNWAFDPDWIEKWGKLSTGEIELLNSNVAVE